MKVLSHSNVTAAEMLPALQVHPARGESVA
jgi:hypothetical protein